MKHVELKASGSGRLSDYARNKYVAPGLSKLTAVGAPDLKDRVQTWIPNYLLNSMFGNSPHHPLILHCLRKIDGAFQEYHEARAFLEQYLNNTTKVSAYFHALRHFETAALLAYHAYETVGTMVEEEVFKANDDCPLRRLNNLQNISKHADSRITNAKYAYPQDKMVPIWLTNEALVCYEGTSLAFTEFAELLTDLAQTADILANPRTSKPRA